MASTDLEKAESQVEPVKYRNMWVQVLLIIVTVGLYGVYWFYATATDMANQQKREEPVFLWTLLIFVPLISFYAYYKYSELFERVSPDINRWILFLLWMLFPPAVWMLVQLKLNKLALAGATAIQPTS